MTDFPPPRLRHFYRLYTLAWATFLPIGLLYLLWRSRRDPLYRGHLSERFGRHTPKIKSPVWVHAVSLGELRSAVPLIRKLLDQGETVLTSHFTPAGRREAQSVFATEIADGTVQAAWVPLEFAFAYRAFFKAFKPKYGLVMEIEIWPRMIEAAHRMGVPLYLCNAQYPAKSFERDRAKSKWRADVMQGYAGAFVKSELQRERFHAVGTPNIHVTGELRFDQHIPPHLTKAGAAFKTTLAARRVITITSVVIGEDETYIPLIKSTRGPDAPLFIYVPRAPERFDETYDLLIAAGLRVARRSQVFDDALNAKDTADFDVLLGDSMGEMYFYLAACDQAIIGGSFVEKGAHNISEPLALGKPCIVGPHTWTIEFPVVEALAAGVCQQVDTAKQLQALIATNAVPSTQKCQAFAVAYKGSTDRVIAALNGEGLS